MQFNIVIQDGHIEVNGASTLSDLLFPIVESMGFRDVHTQDSRGQEHVLVSNAGWCHDWYNYSWDSMYERKLNLHHEDEVLEDIQKTVIDHVKRLRKLSARSMPTPSTIVCGFSV